MPHQNNFAWRVGDKVLVRTRMPLLMGILNVTPDSFSDGGQFNQLDAAVAHGLQLADAGADILDIGGESTRPNAAVVTIEEELQRTIPVIRNLAAQTNVPISIDTTKAEVARQAADAGALIVNDISGMTFDPKMLPLAADGDLAVCVMHIKGTPQTMQDAPHYNDVVSEVTDFLRERRDACTAAGISADRICLDPGIGFGKTAHHNVQLMKSVPTMREELGRPLLVGHSRKRFLANILGRDVEERLAGTIGVSLALAGNQTDILRVHDVQAVHDALVAWDSVYSGKQR